MTALPVEKSVICAVVIYALDNALMYPPLITALAVLNPVSAVRYVNLPVLGAPFPTGVFCSPPLMVIVVVVRAPSTDTFPMRRFARKLLLILPPGVLPVSVVTTPAKAPLPSSQIQAVL